MHAASVHPEPGSNSRNHCIKTSIRMIQSFCFRVLLLASFTFCLSSILIQRIFEIRFAHTLYALYFSLVVQFSKIIVSLRSRGARPCYYTTFIRLCQAFFENFFKFFSGSSRQLPCYPNSHPLGVSLYIILLLPHFVKNFFYFFPFFLPFWHFKQFLYVILYDFFGG